MSVEVPGDTPPLIGAYLYSTEVVPSTGTVDASRLQAYRRAGRTTLKEDFMRLREGSPSEPMVLMHIDGGGSTSGRFFPRQQNFWYKNTGEGWALKVTFRAEHAAYQLRAGPENITLPPIHNEDPQFRQMRRAADIAVLDNDEPKEKAGEPTLLVATYEDAAGIGWRSSLELVPTASSDWYRFTAGRFERRIAFFPPKG